MNHVGKVFISHSSPDKPFVRHLSDKVKGEGFDTWLDEHDLIVGDPLAEEIGKALSSARVILVIISETSVQSNWLKFELNIATTRMIEGKCRVIPIVIDEAPLPDEVKGILYANCRESLDSGWLAIATAIKHENNRIRHERGFWAQADGIVEDVFGNRNYASVSGEYRSRDYEFVCLPILDENSEEYAVVYESISAYVKPASPLKEEWWRDFCDAMKEYPEDMHLILTERPIEFELDAKSERNANVGLRADWFKDHLGKRHVFRTVVFADLSQACDKKGQEDIVHAARAELIEFVKKKSDLL